MALAQSQLRLWHGRDVDALPAAERALSINPNLAEARCVKAHVLEEQGKQEEAMPRSRRRSGSIPIHGRPTARRRD